MPAIAPSPTALETYILQKSRATKLTLLVVVPLAVTILAIEYRVMILCVLLIIPVVIPWGLGRGARKQVEPGGAIGIDCEADGLAITIVRPARDDTSYRTAPKQNEVLRVPWASLPVAVVHPTAPSALVVVVQEAPAKFRRFIAPAPLEEVRAVASVLAGHGTKVSEEPGLAKLGGLFAAVVMWKVLGVVAFGCVAGALANIGLAAAGKGGSYLTGVLLLTGALAALTVAALLRQWFVPGPGSG